jgi:hypothetical protein
LENIMAEGIMSAKTEIGDPTWRPTAVHPLAALFPVLEADDLKSLAEHIKEHGLLVPVVIDAEGVLIDGRMRLRACDMAGVDPTYQSLNGYDAEAYIWGANSKRRQMMTKGMLAMIAAVSFVAKEKGPITTSARLAGVSEARLQYALSVKQHAPHVVDDVIAGIVTLDAAYAVAQENKRQNERRHDGMKMLRKLDKDLAQKVADRELTVDQAFGIIDQRNRDLHAMRDSVLMGMNTGLLSLRGFEKSPALQELPEQLLSDAGRQHFRRYFKGGVKELREKLTAAQAGLDALVTVCATLSKGT